MPKYFSVFFLKCFIKTEQNKTKHDRVWFL